MPAPSKLMTVSKQQGGASFLSPGTYSWTPPSGVTSVTITGRGGSKSSVYYAWATQANVGARMIGGSGFPNNVGPTLSYSRIRSDESSLIPNLNAVTTDSAGQSGVLWFSNQYYWDPNGSYWSYAASSANRTYRRVGTFTANSTLAGLTGDYPNGGSGTYLLGGGTLQYRVSKYDYGTDSTGLGYTFPDDAAQVQYTGVSVVPQQQYTIVVGVDEGADTSFVTIEWE